MFSMGKKTKPEEEPKIVEEIVVKKVEKVVEKEMDSNIKKVDVKIGESATIIGTMKGKCIANIEGCFEGTVELDGDLVLAKTGVLNADVKVKNAVISGNMNGTVYAHESVQIMPTAIVTGDVTSQVLIIERGAKFIGNSKVIDGGNAKPSSIPSPTYDSYNTSFIDTSNETIE